MSYNTLRVESENNGIIKLILNRPDKRNALSRDMLLELTDFAQTTGTSSSTRAIILSGEGKVFCAGGDLEWMKAQLYADRETRMKEARILAEALMYLNQMPSPLIAKVHGGAFGGGIGLLCVCDVAIATEDSRFGLTETRLGLTPATISPYVISRIGEGMARRIFMSSRIFNAKEAMTLGLIAQYTSVQELDREVTKHVDPYLSVAPKAAGVAKLLARSLGDKIDKETIDQTISHLADIWEGDEAKKGISAFLNKQPIDWR